MFLHPVYPLFLFVFDRRVVSVYCVSVFTKSLLGVTVMSVFYPFSRLRLVVAVACLGFLPGCATSPEPDPAQEASAVETMDLAQATEREPITRLAFVDRTDPGETLRVTEEPETDASSPQEPAAIEAAAGEETAQP